VEKHFLENELQKEENVVRKGRYGRDKSLSGKWIPEVISRK